MRRLFVLTAVLLFSCSSGDSVIKPLDHEAPDTVADGSGPDLATPDTGPELSLPDLPEDPDELLFDVPPDEGTGPACAPGEGCFLDPCDEHEDCQSNWCVQHMGEEVCTINCTEECPQGWSCQQVAGTAPDLVFVCVSDFANLCRPCATGDNCKGIGGNDDVCLDYGDEGSFCGGACTTDDDCPWGFLCSDVVTVDGIDTKQCVAETGTCPCTKTAVELALWTPCEVSNEFGTCTGKRVCTEEGLSDCDAAVPAQESCDGQDNDCDGEVDEPNLVDGEYLHVCNDDNACTEDTCLGEEGCEILPLEGGECSDGNPCTAADHCVAGVCVGEPVACDDDNPCTDDICTDTGGCDHLPAAGECDDGDPCTLGDHCSGGACVGEAVGCSCTTNADCAELEDGNLCNGTLFCNLDKLPYQCEVVAESIIDCPAPTGPDAPCLAAVCDPEAGTCGTAPTNDGLPCDDGDPCTLGDLCQAGECAPGAPANCNDGNPCTDDSCDPEAGCVHADANAPCNDGNVCTVNDTCIAGECTPGVVLECDDGNLCNGTETCDVVTGCVAGQPLECDDGNPCNGLETCVPATGCQPGLEPLCNDNNPCTDDLCDPAGGCQFVPNDAACDDGNACTVGDSCSEGLCKAGFSLNCNDDNLCTDDSCDPGQGCVHALNQAPCNDGDVCTINDHCHLGECIPGGDLVCNDNNPCTDDTCQPESGCQFTPNNGECDDGTACTLGDHCVNGACQPSGFLDCDDGNPCTDDACDPEAGCLSTNNTLPCTDGSACTVDDTCADGICVPGPLLDCDDGNPCTDDACDPTVGCTYVLNNAPCDDGNACTANDVCSDSECIGAPVVCEDNDICTDDSCNPLTGCEFVFNQAPCDDNDVCTVDDACDGAGQCVGASELPCDDANECTDDSCDPVQGCLFTPVPNGTPCENGAKHCFSGQCLAGSENLRLYYDFEEGAGNITLDKAPTGNPTDGTLKGNTSFAAPGKLGNHCLAVTGGSPSDYLDIGGNISDLDMGTAYTFMLWVKVTQNGAKGLIALGSCCTGRQGYTMNLKSDGKIRFWGGSSSDDGNYNTYGNKSIQDGQWHHVAIRVKNGSLQILIDGVVDASGSDNLPTAPSQAPTTNTNMTNNPHVGGNGIDNVNGAHVLIDEVRVYNDWLFDGEIQQAMVGAF